MPNASSILKIGLISISDRASTGIYQDKGIPALTEWLTQALITPWQAETQVLADDEKTISHCLIDLVDRHHCHLIFTTGGTGPTRRDITPEATLAVASKVLPGFGEQMRQISLQFVPTAILSRQVAVIRETEHHACLIINLPGQPRSIKETLEGLNPKTHQTHLPGIFSAIPYCIDLLGGPYIETHPQYCQAFRPKKANTATPQVAAE